MKKIRNIRIIIIIITVILLLYSTEIVTYTYSKIGNKFILKEYNELNLKSHNKVVHHIDKLLISNDIFKTLYMKGWAFVETEKNNDGRIINIFLKGDNGKTYMAESRLIWRGDLQQIFSSKKLVSNALGFVTVFSLANLSDDEYKIFINVYENNINYGIVDTGKIIKIHDGNYEISDFKYKSTPVLIEITSNIDDLTFNIDKNNADTSKVEISGWAYYKKPIDNIYIGLTNNGQDEIYYTVSMVERKDVAKKFNNLDLLNSGFYANIILDNEKNYKLSSIIIEYKGKYYKQEIGKQQRKVENREVGNYSTIFNINEKDKLNSDNILMNIDNSKNSENTLTISGWAYIKDKKKTGKVYVGMKGKTGKETYYTVEPIERPDVVKHFNNVDLLNSGFTANIKIDNIEDYQLSSIVIEYDGKYYKKALK